MTGTTGRLHDSFATAQPKSHWLRKPWAWAKNARLRLIENFLLAVAVIITFSALVFLAPWLYANLWLPGQMSTLRIPETPLDLGNGQSMQVDYPAVILADDKPAVFLITLRSTSTLTDTVVTAVVPSDLTLVAPIEQAHALTVTIPISATRELSVQGATFELLNARTMTGWPLLANRTITLDSPSLEKPLELNLRVESVFSAALRTFVNSTVNEKSPLIILVAGLLSGAGALYTYSLQKAEKEAEREKEKERTKAAEREKEKERTKAAETLREFRTQILAENFERAQTILTELRKPELARYVGGDLAIAEDLMRLKDGVGDLTTLVQNTKVWADECAAAYLKAHREVLDRNPAALRDARIYTPKDEIASADLRSRLEATAYQEPDLQPREWPGDLVIPAPVAPIHPPFFMDDAARRAFEFERAEDDQYNLFGPVAAFWSGHDVYRTLASSSAPHVITGPPGSGCTAFALALGRYLVNRDQLSVYLPGQPDLGEIRSGFAQLLLDFAITHPTLLSKLSTAERALVARMFMAVLGRDYARAEVKAAQSGLASAKWLKPDTALEQGSQGAAEDQPRKEGWKRLATHQLLLLEQEISQTSLGDWTDDSWPRELNRCARSLGFARVTLVLDVTAEGAERANTTILPNLRRWRADGLLAYLFLPETAAAKIKVTDGITVRERLTWTPAQLTEMALWRYRAFAGDRAIIESRFAPGEFEKLIEKSIAGDRQPNPRRLAQLWKTIMRQVPPEKAVDAADIQHAVEATE